MNVVISEFFVIYLCRNSEFFYGLSLPKIPTFLQFNNWENRVESVWNQGKINGNNGKSSK